MFSKSFSLAIILSLYSAFSHAGTPFRRCSPEYPVPLSFQIDDCETSPCTLIRGRTAKMDVQFVATKDDTYYLKSQVRAKVLGITTIYPLPGDGNDVCKNLAYGAYCPLYATEDVTYHIDFPMDNYIPELTLKCEIEITDINEDVVMCLVVDLRVRKG